MNRARRAVAAKQKEEKVASASVGKVPTNKVKIMNWVRGYHTHAMQRGPFP